MKDNAIKEGVAIKKSLVTKERVIWVIIIAVIIVIASALIYSYLNYEHTCIRDSQIKEKIGEINGICCYGLHEIDSGYRDGIVYCTREKCGDSKCQGNENKYNCPEDCPINVTENIKYSCDFSFDCVSTCALGCVNNDWRKNFNDTCVNIRAYNCSCVNKICYSDGLPPYSE